MNTRRQFLIRAPLGVLGAAMACQGQDKPAAVAQTTPGAPPTFGTAPGAGPEVTAATFAEAEKLAQVTMTSAERDMAAASWRKSMASYLERRTGPRKVPLAADIAPATKWNPALPGVSTGPARDAFVRSRDAGASLPSNDADIAFAPVTQLRTSLSWPSRPLQSLPAPLRPRSALISRA